jgi:hypothetical protein
MPLGLGRDRTNYYTKLAKKLGLGRDRTNYYTKLAKKLGLGRQSHHSSNRNQFTQIRTVGEATSDFGTTMWYYCAVTGESKKKISRVGQRKKSRVAEPRVIFGVPTSENNF